jgi:hypothetical protein
MSFKSPSRRVDVSPFYIVAMTLLCITHSGTAWGASLEGWSPSSARPGIFAGI